MYNQDIGGEDDSLHFNDSSTSELIITAASPVTALDVLPLNHTTDHIENENIINPDTFSNHTDSSSHHHDDTQNQQQTISKLERQLYG